MNRVVLSLIISIFMTSCGGSSSNSAGDLKVKETCPLVEEAWTTYLERNLDETNLDILAASWYIVKEELSKVAETDSNYSNLVKGAEDALNGDYLSQELTDLLVFCDLSR